MTGWITALLNFFGFGAKIASKNQDIINSPDVVRGKVAKQDAADKDEIHRTGADIEKVRNDFSR